ncbi:MAG: ABC transporter ATP-binding protein [Caldilineaceae bacterium]|nr:ABC transporter ATP-binding protein [Caldilineaceae bacterium]
MPGLRKVFPYTRPYRWMLVLGFITTVLPVLMELVTPAMLRVVIDEGIRGQNMDRIWYGAGMMLLAALVGAATTIGQGIARAQISQGIAFDLRNKLFRHIQAFSFANLDRAQTGQLMTRISSDVDVVRMFLSAGLALLIRALLMIVGSVVMMLLIDWQLSLWMFGALTLAAVIIRFFLILASPLFSQVQQRLGALNTTVQESLAGIRVGKAYVREQHTIERFADNNRAYMEKNIQVGRYLALVLPALLVLTNVGATLIIWRGGLDVIGGRLTLGELVALSNYLMIGMSPLLLLSNILSMVSRAEASATRLAETLETRPAIQPPATARRPAQVRGGVSFENVSFHYTGSRRAAPAQSLLNGAHAANGAARERPVGEEVLDGVSFGVLPGQKVALMGVTGAGKSSLINLIPRFYDVTGGRICVDGLDIREWDPVELRRQIGVVMQENTLFSGTVRQNIAYGRPDASMDDVIAAAKAAQAHDFIQRMPDGYESLVENRGGNFSGGQKQRIAIARALLIKPAILLLDDSTSAVDLETEVRIQDALAEQLADTTTFLIAQRVSSVLDSDQILILDEGRIAGQGTHAELLAGNEIYREIYRSQFGEETV